jgi:hypothetical protein
MLQIGEIKAALLCFQPYDQGSSTSIIVLPMKYCRSYCVYHNACCQDVLPHMSKLPCYQLNGAITNALQLCKTILILPNSHG